MNLTRGPYARNFHPGRRKPVRLLVVHDMESPESHRAAENVAQWMAGPTAPNASAHLLADDDSVVESVKVGDTAFGAPGANSDGYHLENAGVRNQGPAGWRDRFSLLTIDNLCTTVAGFDELDHIPALWLTDDQLADGITPGLTTHEQITRVFALGTHTDPGPDFPKAYMAAQLVKARGGHDPRPVPVAVDRWLRFTNPRMHDMPGLHDVSNLHTALIAIAPGNRTRLAADLPGRVYGLDTAAVVADYQLHRGITTERGVGPLTLARIRSEVH